MLREIVESSAFSSALRSMGNVRRLDEVLVGVHWAVSRNPEAFDIVPGMADVRLIKTAPSDDLPGLSIWFRLLRPGGPVELLFLEPRPESD